MVIMVPWLPWLRIQAFLNWHLIRSTIRTIIILFANQLQLRWWELQGKYKYWYCLCIYLVIAYRLIERICDFSLRVFILNGFSHYWYSNKVLSCYQVFLLAQIYGEYICIYVCIFTNWQESIRGERLKYDSRSKPLSSHGDGSSDLLFVA